MTMVDRIAKAICLAGGQDPEEPHIVDGVRVGVAWQAYRGMARAVLRSMRDPTEDMTKCAIQAGWHGGIEGDEACERDAGAALYTAMIDTALAEQP